MTKPTVDFRNGTNALQNVIVLKLTKWMASFSLSEYFALIQHDILDVVSFNQKALSGK
jgi:hypothetical protein